MKKRVLAFTLAELLMATLVMSIILTALAPVMTKRTLDNVNIGQIKITYPIYSTGDNTSCGGTFPVKKRYA